MPILVAFDTAGNIDFAPRFWDAMRKRLEGHSVSVHPDKIRLIEFGRLATDQRSRRGLGKPETFRYLGFSLSCGRSRRWRTEKLCRSYADGAACIHRRILARILAALSAVCSSRAIEDTFVAIEDTFVSVEALDSERASML
jgi:hypothetical protein